jgi:hypothetical protein
MRTQSRLVVALFLLCSCFSATGIAQTNRDGYLWNQSSKSAKTGYVIGFTDAAAWALGNVDGQLQLLKLTKEDRSLLKEGRKVWDYESISYAQLVDALDQFYSDALNKGIKWDRAISYVRDCIHGEPKEFLEKELAFERRLATVH